MKEICIKYYKPKIKESILLENKKYQIFISNGKRKYFTNKKEAEKYLASFNRNITLYLDEIINMLILIYPEIWKTWFSSNYTFNNLFEKIRNIERLINNIHNRATNDNSDSIYFIIRNLSVIIDDLFSIIENLIYENKQVYKYGNNRILKVYKKNLENIKNDIDNI